MAGLKRAERGHLAVRSAEALHDDPAPAAAPQQRKTTPAAKKPAAPTRPRAVETAPTPAPTRVVSHRGRKGVQFRWPSEFVDRLRDVCYEYADAYQDVMSRTDSTRPYRLALSSVVEAGTMFALDPQRVGEWLDTVPESARVTGESVDGWQKVQVVWGADSLRLLDRAVHPLSRQAGRTLTKAAVVRAAVDYALDHMDEWLAEIPNDARLAAPTPEDGRLRENRTPRRTGRTK